MNFTRLLEWPQLLYILFSVVIVVGALILHGKTIKVRVWAVASYYTIVYVLMHWGGFFE